VLTIELKVTDDALIGKFVPAYRQMEVVGQKDDSLTVAVDEVGYFVNPIPSGPFYLHCRTTEFTSVLTDWMTPWITAAWRSWQPAGWFRLVLQEAERGRERVDRAGGTDMPPEAELKVPGFHQGG
jgi:hypothetical protein